MTAWIPTLLLIDNAPADRELYRRYLCVDGGVAYRLLEAETAVAGLELCRTEKIDAILLDYFLPDADGLAFLASLHTQSHGSSPPVVMIAGKENARVAVQAVKLGAEDYLLKQHLTPEQLQLAIRSAIAKARLRLRQEDSLPPAERELGGRDGTRMPIWSRVTQGSESPAAHVAFAVDLTSRKQAETAQPASQPRYQQLADAMPQMVWTADANGLVNYWNRQWYEYSGLSVAESLGKASATTIHPEDRDRTVAQWEQSIATGTPFKIEYRVRRRDGVYHWFICRSTPTHNSAGQVIGWIGTITDIDELKQAQTEREQLLNQLAAEQQRLQQSEKQLQLGIQVAGVAIAHFDYATDQVTLSPEAATLYGFSVDQNVVTRTQIHATFHPEERDELMETIRQVLDPNGGGWFSREHRVVWSNGTVRWLNVRKQVFFDRQTARPTNAILAAIDITDEKATAATLRESEAHLRYTVELNPQVPWTAAPDGRIVHFSPRWLELTGMTREQALDEGWVQAPHPDDLPAMVAAWSHSIATGEPYDIEHRIKLADGSSRWMRSRALPRRNLQGEIVQWYGTTEDIDDRKQIEFEREELLKREQAARAEAELANRSKDEFVSLVAHELRSPLNAVLGWAKLLQTREFDAASTQKALATIARNTQAQAQLIEDLLDVSRMVRGELRLEFATVHLRDVVQAAIETIRPTAEDRLLQIEMQIDPVNCIQGDANRLQQVVLNLLTNAVKFTPQGGRIQVLLDQSDTQARIQISDTGKGISPEFLPHIFERFRQDQQNTTAKQGLGLGLAIVRYIVEQHGGAIAAHSQGAGQGATFTVLLPQSQTDRPETEFLTPPPADPVQTLSGVRVLLVDDDPDMLNLIALILEQAGAVVQTAHRAAVALAHLPNFQPTILMSDIAMPEMNGYELLRQVRRLDAGNQIPAVALTAYAGEAYRKDSLQAGFADHLTKPVEPADLIRVILRVINRRHP